MANIFKMSRRNILRSRRRTFITAASIMFAVFYACVMDSIQQGTWDNMVNGVVNFYYGFAQVQTKDYWEDKSMNDAFIPGERFENIAEEIDEVEAFVPRLESFALASHGNYTKGTLVVGVDPEMENSLTQLESRVSAGSYFEKDDSAVLIAEGLADYLKLTVGDTVVLISQGYRGANAAGKYHIKGLLNFGSPELNKQMLYLPIEAARWLYAADNLATSLVLKTSKPREVKNTVEKIKDKLNDDQMVVVDYEELIPDLIEAKEMDASGNKLIMAILYVIIGFGIFGTVVMMIKEREYEFGVLKAIGLKGWQLSIMVWLETIFIGLLGIILGILLSYPLTLYFFYNPIELTGEFAEAYEQFGIEPLMKAVADPAIFIRQSLIILLMVTIVAFFPIRKLLKLDPISAMRH